MAYDPVMDELTRVCSFCLARMPASKLSEDLSQCLDLEACRARAQDAMIYPLTDQDAIEQALAMRDALSGAVVRS
jgi:hypothetical protein